jgi:pyruvate/2-oxoglutarate/acetoin dehydrogenase E1 component/TPP-dependent pyruvate/acetoin dehydrogenase alpha subunit
MLDFFEEIGLEPITEPGEEQNRQEVLKDLWVCLVSREASILGRKEVLNGRAKFGILGDGKELAQVALARAFKKGDFRAGYYRDQTMMFALGLMTVEQFFAQLYADSDNDPFSKGRQMNNHFATPLIDQEGKWMRHTENYNSSADISSTAGQMARALGLALASKQYRIHGEMDIEQKFSKQGNEVVFCTIGDASTSEGVFWETLNAAAITEVPLVVSIWDDGYGISVPRELQTVKSNISNALRGFEIEEEGNGIHMYQVKGNDYPNLVATYEKATARTREDHIPCLVHVVDMTQPLGHSTSGSHERYKSKERLEWEQEADGITHFMNWIKEAGIADESFLGQIVDKAKEYARKKKSDAWSAYLLPIREKQKALIERLRSVAGGESNLEAAIKEIESLINPSLAELVKGARKFNFYLKNLGRSDEAVDAFIEEQFKIANGRYHTHLYSNSKKAAVSVPAVPAVYSADSQVLSGYQIINNYFDQKFGENPLLMAFGEDVGQIGGVNQGFANLQAKYGVDRVFDAGIREWTIVGEALGLAMRGIRPIAEIQYLDYLIYGLSPMSDDISTLRYRSGGIQMAPVVIRTRGHRLEGIWHAGSPLGMLLSSLRGMYIMVPRNMTQAAGFYNTMIKSDDPGLIIESLNGYRLKEKQPDNLSEFTLPLGVPEILHEGIDVTLVTYGSVIREAIEAIHELEVSGISVELIDLQTLLPFDLEGVVVNSLKKTNKLIVLDEDIPGGASAYILQQILEEQDGWQYLDEKPLTITAHAHRPPYGSDGDYFSKPNSEDIMEQVRGMMQNYDSSRFRK